MKYITLILFGYLLSWVWIIVPVKNFTKSPFVFFNYTAMPMQNYAEWLGARLLFICLAWVSYTLAADFQFKGEGVLKIAFWLFVGYAIDYILIFNQPYAYLAGGKLTQTKPDGFFIPISYSLVMGFILIILFVLQWLSK